MHIPVWFETVPAAEIPRIDRIVFRRTLVLSNAPAAADLHLLARLRYALRVNGAEIGTGPVRSYPEFHEYDSYDLLPHLVPGENTLDVEVLHWSMATFHNLQEAPGFEAWGVVVAPNGSETDLSTPGVWSCRRIAGVDATAPRLSFAQPPVEFLDFAADAADASDWRTPVTAAPDPTAVPFPRSIPPLTRLPLAPAAMTASTALDEGEFVFGGRVVDDGDGSNPFSPRDRFAALAVWIHSPSDQTVLGGGWWGEYLLNGTPVAVANDPKHAFRQTLTLPFRAGWNKLAVSQGLAFGFAEFCIALPRAANLDLRLAPNAAAPVGFHFTPAAFSDELLRANAEAFASVTEPLPDFGWQSRDLDTPHPSPLRHVAWAQPSGDLRAIAPGTALRLPAGSSTLVTLDMGQLVLARLSLDLEAPAGTIVDFDHAEETRGKWGGTEPAPQNTRARVEKACVVYGADRWIAAAGRRTYTSLSPRGFRYVDLVIDVPADGPDAILHGVTALEERYPYVYDATAEADFGDADLNRLWTYGRRTLELCSNDVFVDCPWRERTLYGGDLLPEFATSLVFSRHDLRLARHSIDVELQSIGLGGWLESQAPAPRDVHSLGEYPLLTSIAAGWYLRLTDDQAFAVRAWPVFRAMSETVASWRRADGLYALPGRAFIDHGRKIGEGATCEFNSALVAGFRAWAVAARMAGDPAAAASLEAKAEALDARIPGAFFDAAAGTFRDQPLADGGNVTEGTPPNSWPLLFTKAAHAHAKEAVAAIRAAIAHYDPSHEPDSVSPYQMFYLLSALHAVGADDVAEEAIRKVYAGMLEHPTGTFWEHGHTNASLVHAWSSGVNYYLAVARTGRELGF